MSEQYFKNNNDEVSDQIITPEGNYQDNFSEFKEESGELSESVTEEIDEPFNGESSGEFPIEIPQPVLTEPETVFESQQEKLGTLEENDQILSNPIEPDFRRNGS